MCVIEALLESTLPNIQDMVKRTCRETLECFRSTSHIAVKNKAIKVMCFFCFV